MPPVEAADQTAEANGSDFGLSADEQAAYDSMRSVEPASGEPGFVEPEQVPATVDAPAADALAPTAGAPAADAPAEADDDDDDDTGHDATKQPANGERQQKRVGYAKYQRLETEAAATRAKLEAALADNVKRAESQARLDERLKLINEALTTPAAGPQAPVDDDPRPDPEADIFGFVSWQERQMAKLNGTITELRSGREAEVGEQQLASTYVDDAQRFSQTEPNFGPAYQHLMEVRLLQLANYHYGKDLTDPNCPPLTSVEQTRIKGEVAREEKALVARALKEGKSPAAAVYAMARMTGYRPNATGPAGQTLASAAAKPAALAPPAAAAPAKPSVKAEIDRIKAGQDAALSLSSGGGVPAGSLTPEKLANMPDEEFGALVDQMSRGDFARIMGGRA